MSSLQPDFFKGGAIKVTSYRGNPRAVAQSFALPSSIVFLSMKTIRSTGIGVGDGRLLRGAKAGLAQKGTQNAVSLGALI